MRGRWGTFSVRDHMTEAPFVSDVLLYDRLIIPVPDPADTSIEEKTVWHQWEPDKLQDCLNILQVKTETRDGLALTIPWDKIKRERFASRMSTAAALATQQRTPEQTYYTDPFAMTRDLIKNEFLPALPAGVSKAWTVAAYTSTRAFNQDVADPERRPRLAMLISHRFLTPAKPDPRHEVLKRAVGLASTDDFRHKRARLYAWQEEIIEENISDEKALEEMDHLLAQYNKATETAFGDVTDRFLFMAIPVGLAMSSALQAGTMAALVLGVAGGFVQTTRFCRFDRKPRIEAGDLDAAAMIHDARKELPLR